MLLSARRFCSQGKGRAVPLLKQIEVMEISQLVEYLENAEDAEPWLKSWGLENPQRGHRNLVNIASMGITLDLLVVICNQLGAYLPDCSDPDMALNNLERFFQSARNPLALGSLFERDDEALPILIRIFSTSQFFSDLLITDSGAYELLRITQGMPVTREVLIQELTTELMAMSTPQAMGTAIRRFKRRETLRIGYGDIICGQSLQTVTQQISYLADACVHSTIQATRLILEQKYGTPINRRGEPAKYVVLALGKLGGEELNYSSDIDLICYYDSEGQTNGSRPISNEEFFSKVTREMVKLLSEVTEFGQAYRVDLRLRPNGKQGALVYTYNAAMNYYDVFGRTWERQAYVKARAIAGDIDLGEKFLKELQPWIYRRYLTLADITGIKALKRRIEERTKLEEGDQRKCKDRTRRHSRH